MDAALENSPGPPKWMNMGGTPRPGYPVDPSPKNVYVFPPQPVNTRDPEHGNNTTKTSATVCCGCSKRTALITAIVLAVLLLAGAALGVGLGLGLNKSDPSPKDNPAVAPSPVADSPASAPEPAAAPPVNPDCSTDQECWTRGEGWWCVAGVCGYQLPDTYYCNKTAEARRCFSTVCGDTTALGFAMPEQPFACLITTGNRCKRPDACASGVCKELGSNTAPARYCVSKTGVADQPPAKFVKGSPCKVDVDCGGHARCLQSQCSQKADYGETCGTSADCFSGDCLYNADLERNICTIADGALCGTIDFCKKGSRCSTDGYCVPGSTTPTSG